MENKVAVIGAGSWGTAIAHLLSRKANEVILWAYEDEIVKGINGKGKNPLYLSNVKLGKNIHATNDLEEALSNQRVIISVVPSHALRNVWNLGSKYISGDAILVSCTKGIEVESLKLMNQVLSECLPNHRSTNRCSLSGPSFAKEVARDLPTSVVIAGSDAVVCKRVQDIFRTDTFLTFTSDDVIGVEVGGAIKNVIAIAAGISEGLNLGHNSRAAIITRGLYEMMKIGKALRANPLTFTGLSGIGDLVLTCTAELSRNYTLGVKLGQGTTIDKATHGSVMVAEGINTTKAAKRLAVKHKISTPICDAMHRILFEGLAPDVAVRELCTLPLKEELGSILR